MLTTIPQQRRQIQKGVQNIITPDTHVSDHNNVQVNCSPTSILNIEVLSNVIGTQKCKMLYKEFAIPCSNIRNKFVVVLFMGEA